MASIKEIKNRIKSVQDTRKITNAMYLISSTKLRKARKRKGSYRMLSASCQHYITISCLY